MNKIEEFKEFLKAEGVFEKFEANLKQQENNWEFVEEFNNYCHAIDWTYSNEGKINGSLGVQLWLNISEKWENYLDANPEPKEVEDKPINEGNPTVTIYLRNKSELIEDIESIKFNIKVNSLIFKADEHELKSLELKLQALELIEQRGSEK